MDVSPCRHLLPGRSAQSLAPDEPGAIGFPCAGGFRFQSRARQDRVSVMSPVSLLLNIIWIVFGGAWMAFGWLVAAVIMAITIIGIPWARAAFNIAAYTLFPFGFTAISRDAYTGREDIGTGPLGVIGNIIWLVLAGWGLGLRHAITGVVLALAGPRD